MAQVKLWKHDVIFLTCRFDPKPNLIALLQTCPYFYFRLLSYVDVSKGRKNFFWGELPPHPHPPPLCKGLDDRAFPLSLVERSGSSSALGPTMGTTLSIFNKTAYHISLKHGEPNVTSIHLFVIQTKPLRPKVV